MNNPGPGLVLRGAIIGCVIICALVSLINGSSSSAALAASGLPAASQPATNQNEGNGHKADQSKKGDCKLSPSYPPSIQQWCGLISQAAKQNGLPANLIGALIMQESGGQASAYSASGAVGLMQVMPRDGIAASFQCANGPCFASRPTIAELQDPAFNIDYGTRFLAGLVEKRGSLREALYAYGPMSVGYSYADKVLGIYASYGGE
jgi:soluble lytic murein transglycosylase-like protein